MKKFIDFVMFLYGTITGKLFRIRDIGKFSDIFFFEYEIGGLHKDVNLSVTSFGKGPFSIAYELGHGKKTGNFIVFNKLIPDEKGIIDFRIYLGEEPCRFAIFSKSGRIVSQIRESEVIDKNVSEAHLPQKGKGKFEHYKIVGNTIIPMPICLFPRR